MMSIFYWFSIKTKFKKQYCFLFAIILSFSISGFSQEPSTKKKFQGTIVDEIGIGIPGVKVELLESNLVVGTNLDGEFTFEYDSKGKGVTVKCSFIGFVTKEVKIFPNKPVKISLKEDVKLLEEVVVTGYGNFKKSAYAGSASTLRTGNIKDVPATSFSNILQGAAPGVQISSSSGQPGAVNSVRIRGMGSFNASNSPLYVIDGVPVNSGGVNTMSSGPGLDIMSTINNSDIENITIIKDAAAASLYGSRAANGVILITTKQGKSGKPVFSFKSDWGVTDFAMQYRPIMGGEERRQYIYNGLLDAAKLYDKLDDQKAKEYADKNIDKYAPIPWNGYTDWFNVLFKKGNHQSYEISASGGGDKMKYYSSVSYLQQEGVTLNSSLNRISGRLNVNYKMNNKFTLGTKILFANIKQGVDGEGTSYTSPYYSSRNAVVPSDFVYNEDGSWNRNFIRNKDRNPILSATYDYQKEYVTRGFNTIFGEYELIKDLKLKSTFSYDFVISKGERWSDPRTSGGEATNGNMSKLFRESKKTVWSNTANYKKRFSENNNFDALIGYEIDDTYYDNLSGSASNFARYDKNAISNGMKTESVGGADSNSRLVSYLSRVNYDYKYKYFLGGSYRIDGSSRLHEGSNRWGHFWSLSAAWRTIEEDFMQPYTNWLTDLKLRSSYGVNGTLPSNYYGYMGLSSIRAGYMEQPSIIQSQIENPELRWETNHNLNIGIDFSLFNRIDVTVEGYTRTTKDLLMDHPISLVTGFSSYLMNIGKVSNKGIEATITSTNIKRKDFSWNTTLNIGHNSNKIIQLDGKQTEIIGGYQIRRIGHAYRTFYMIEFAGIDAEDGEPQFYINKEGSRDLTKKPSQANRVLYKNADPSVSGGLSNTFQYKGFDLNFMLSYQFGAYALDNWAQKTEHGGADLRANIPLYYRNSWKKKGDDTNIERFIAKRSVAMRSNLSTRNLHSTDFVRLKNLSFGYTLPKSLTQKVDISNLRIYISGNNLLTWAKYDQYDPEAVSGGSAIWGTPPLRTIIAGVSISF